MTSEERREVRKVKTVFGEGSKKRTDCVRLEHVSESDFAGMAQEIAAFAKATYGLKKGSFYLAYVDDENDLLTIGNADDMRDALALATHRHTTLKVFVCLFTDSDTTTETTTETKTESSNSEPAMSATNKESTSSCGLSGSGNDTSFVAFIESLAKDERLKKEFVSFVSDFVSLVQQSANECMVDLNTVLTQALSMHESVLESAFVKDMASKTAAYASAFSPMVAMVVCWLRQVRDEDIPAMVDSVIAMVTGTGTESESGCSMLPQWLASMVGSMKNNSGNGQSSPNLMQQLMPLMMGRGYGHHWRGRGRGRGRCGGRGGTATWTRGCYNSNNRGKAAECGLAAEIVKDEKDISSDSSGNKSGTKGVATIAKKGQVYVKTWKVKNTGKVQWPEGTYVQYRGRPNNPLVSDNRSVFAVKSPVSVGEEIEVSIAVEVPDVVGRYNSNWRLTCADGTVFGQALRCYLVVVGEDNEDKEKQNKGNGKEDNSSSNSYAKKAKEVKKAEKIAEKKERKNEKLEAKREKLMEKLALVNAKIAHNSNDNTEDNTESNNERATMTVTETVTEKKNEEVEVAVAVVVPESNNNGNDDIEVSSESDSAIKDGFVELAVSEEAEPVSETEYKYREEMQRLVSMGFQNVDLLKQLLESKNGDVDAVVNSLLA